MAALAAVPAGPFVVQAPDGQVFRFDTPEQAAQFEAKIKEGGGTALRLEPAAPPLPLVARPLYDLEEHLAALADSAELVSPDQEAEYLADFERTLLATREKRDRVGEFLAACEGQAALAQREIERLQKRTALYQSAVERLEGYLASILHAKGKDAKGKWQKLEGNTHTFSLKNTPPSVAIQDEESVPAVYKSITVTLPASLWEELCGSLDLDMLDQVLDAVKSPRSSVSKAEVKAAIAEAVPDYLEMLKSQPAVYTAAVPGATIAAGGTRLVRS
jgi:hypothetical protein